MSSVIQKERGEQIAHRLVGMLHQGAAAEEFAQCLQEIEGMPERGAEKSSLVETVRMAMAVHNRLELLSQRERGMSAVIESAKDLSSQLDVTSLLKAIVARARKLLGSDLAWLSGYDTALEGFRVLVADGAVSPRVSAMVARQDHGVASIVMSTRNRTTANTGTMYQTWNTKPRTRAIASTVWLKRGPRGSIGFGTDGDADGDVADGPGIMSV
jgi:hypothetical protein